MRSFWRAVRPYLILALLGGALIWPLLGADVPCTDDGGLYYYQAVATRHSLVQGVVYSRWLPDAALGYGIPFYAFREPLTRYLVLAFLLAGANGPPALNLTFALGVLIAGWGVYRLARDVFQSEAAGVAAGVAAMAAPYTMLIFYRRGALAESYALVLLPWVLWAFWRAGRDGGAWPVVRAALILGAFALAHNISMMLALPVVGLYAVIVARLHNGRRRAWLRSIAAYLAGIGLAAFFLVPAYVERNLVRTAALTSIRNNTYFYNFVDLAELFSPPTAHNPAWLNPAMTIHVGLVLVLLAFIGWVAGWFLHKDRARRAHLAFFGLLAVGYIVMVLPISRPVWDAIPLLAFVQFPWRLIGQASVMLAVLAGVGIGLAVDGLAARVGSWAGAVGMGVALMALVGLGLPGTYPVGWCQLPAQPTIADVHAFELGFRPGLDDVGSIFPVGAMMPEESPLLADYVAGEAPQRFDQTALPAGATLEADYRPLGAAVRVVTPEPFRARYLSYDFPGWRVMIDGEQTPILPEEGTGLITFDVPEGTHTIDVRFGLTPLRAAATGLSALTLVALGAWLWRDWRRGRAGLRPGARNNRNSGLEPAIQTDWLLLGVMAAVGVVMIVARAAWPDSAASPWRAAHPPTPQHAMDALFDGQVRLLGYDLESDVWPADQEFRVDTYWLRVAEMTRDTGVAWMVVDERGILWSEKEGIAPRGEEEPPVPTFAWPLDAYATDSQLIRLLPGTPPGHYTLTVTLYDQETLQPFVTPFGEGVTARLPLQTVTVTWPEQPWPIDSLGIQYPLDAPVGDLTLLGCNLDREEAGPGEAVLATLFWESLAEIPEAAPAALALDGEVVEGAMMMRPAGSIPAGAVWREQSFLRFPASAEAGEHTVGVMVEGEPPITLATITVRALTRIFEPPPVAQPVDALFAESARLVGFDASEEGNQLAITLVWAAEADMPTSYTVFVHALDAEGNIVAQSDAIPADGTRPTTGWLTGEYVADTHVLPISADQVTALRIGLYDAAAGARLRLDDGTDAVIVPLTAAP
jgi:hypothetical protein